VNSKKSKKGKKGKNFACFALFAFFAVGCFSTVSLVEQSVLTSGAKLIPVLGQFDPANEHRGLALVIKRESKARLLSVYLRKLAGTAFGLTVR
jgi:hypothetical protein